MELRIEVEQIEATKNGQLDGHPDWFRRFAPGMVRYYIDDVEATKAEYQWALGFMEGEDSR
jgi:hypothetical protein